jgi:hypothetical protein
MPRGSYKPTPEEVAARIAKVQVTKSETYSKRNRKITVGRWSVFQFDELNWACVRNDTQDGEEAVSNSYYGRCADALNCLLHKTVGDTAIDTGSLQAVLAAIKDAERSIKEQLQRGVLSGEASTG